MWFYDFLADSCIKYMFDTDDDDVVIDDECFQKESRTLVRPSNTQVQFLFLPVG